MPNKNAVRLVDLLVGQADQFVNNGYEQLFRDTLLEGTKQALSKLLKSVSFSFANEQIERLYGVAELFDVVFLELIRKSNSIEQIIATLDHMTSRPDAAILSTDEVKEKVRTITWHFSNQEIEQKIEECAWVVDDGEWILKYVSSCKHD